MNERIEKLTALTLKGKMYVDCVSTVQSDMDLTLSRMERESDALCKYILNQEPKITE